jgi:hypothetical protein
MSARPTLDNSIPGAISSLRVYRILNKDGCPCIPSSCKWHHHD